MWIRWIRIRNTGIKNVEHNMELCIAYYNHVFKYFLRTWRTLFELKCKGNFLNVRNKLENRTGTLFTQKNLCLLRMKG
jgi:hypothetical protein